MSELKTCPFCGGEARLVVCDSEGNVHDESYEADPYSGLSYAIVHGSDDCCGECPVSTSDLLPWLYETREEATAAWNRRAERTCHVDLTESNEPSNINTWECSLCGRSFEEAYGSYEFCPHCGARIVEEGR